ncbi:MAG: glycerophosphodiester phosphodiesterase [Planctomycetes bacterium]|nr:glycerophosphodiester phosphodiesterase [Planctomycetota bacterium]MCB9918377.1 glycerophosphodiester phosphodiesterase [Planctomycetota bacterium]
MTTRPTLVAHRGNAAEFPENTIPALESAIAAGASWIEIDVQRTGDGRLVLFHDGDLKRLCNVGGTIHGKSSTDLSMLPCYEPARFDQRYVHIRVATLAEFAALMLAHPSVEAFVEIKHEAFVGCSRAQVLEEVASTLAAVRERCVLISFSFDFLELARTNSEFRLGAVAEKWQEFEDPIIRRIAPDFFFCNMRGLPPDEFIRHRDFPSSRIAVWEINDPGIALSLGARGIHLVETFEIATMLRSLRAFDAPVG